MASATEQKPSRGGRQRAAVGSCNFKQSSQEKYSDGEVQIKRGESEPRGYQEDCGSLRQRPEANEYSTGQGNAELGEC